MTKGGCVNGGDLVTTSYSTPVPWIDLYIAAATLVCLIFMTRDFLHGLIHRKPFLPCKWFQLNALTLTLLQVATKIPGDLIASMPRADDQLSKLTGTALLCTAIGFYMPSLGTMGTSERYSNMVALSMMVINVVVNVCIQMRTGPIFAFTTEHIIIIICILVLLLLMWSSALAFGGQIQVSKDCYKYFMGGGASNVQELEELLKKVHVLNYTGNPQSFLCETWHHHAFGLLCVLSFIVVLQATLRSVVFKTMRFYSGVDDYQWFRFIPFVIATQLLTIGVGTCSIIYRWYTLIRHTDVNLLFQSELHEKVLEGELENLHLKTLSFWVFGKNISAVLQIPKDVIIERLICTQIMLHGCSKWFVAVPIYRVKMFFSFIIAFFHSGCQHDKGRQHDRCLVISSIWMDAIFNNWIFGMAREEYKRWTKKYNERWRKQKNDDERINCQTPAEYLIIPFILKWGRMHASKSECFVLGQTLERLCRHRYKVSSLSILVLSRMLIELMPSSSSTRWSEFLEESSKALDESFGIIYYVDHKTLCDKTRLSLTKHVWANWKNPKHWFHEIISYACTLPKNSENSENYSDQLQHACEVLNHARHAYDRYVDAEAFKKERQLTPKQKNYSDQLQHACEILWEISTFCKFILKEKHESIEDLFDFLEKSFVKMLCLTLSALPKAIQKQTQRDYPYGISVENVREAIKAFYALKSLENIVEWSWKDEVLSADGEKHVQSFVDAPVSEVEDDQAEAPSTDESEAPSTDADHRSCTGWQSYLGCFNWFSSRRDASDLIDEAV